MDLPFIRQDLDLIPSRPDRQGRPTWLLYDGSRNAFFRIREKALHILAQWQGGGDPETLVARLKASGADADRSDIEEICAFVTGNSLTENRGRQETAKPLASARKPCRTILYWLVTRYLYLRIPLFRPDRFLTRTLPLARPFLSRHATVISGVLGGIGLVFISRQWDQFLATFTHFFSWDGMVWFGLTLCGLKTVHELGHAYTAKSLGCRVPSMGIAFLVLYPFLYTDTTDSWRLVHARDRFKISRAGIRSELCLAGAATFLWSFCPEGHLKSALFFLATTGWISSLAINLSPFMRFDGYYILGDLLNVENLQSRAFAHARHRLREGLFRFGHPDPEDLPPSLGRIFLIYAWCTWVYRFFLFLGIAVLVYHLFFKILGLILFGVEIWWFVLGPVARECRTWWRFRHRAHPGRTLLTAGGLLMLAALLFLPWKTHMVVPAIFRSAGIQAIFPPEDARITYLRVAHGDRVETGAVLAELFSPGLDQEIRKSRIRMALLEIRLARHHGSAQDLEQIQVIQGELAAEQSRIKGLFKRRKRLSLIAPGPGTVFMAPLIANGQWVSRRTCLLTIADQTRIRVSAYIPETDLQRLTLQRPGRFLAQSGLSCPVLLVSIAPTARAYLDDPELASIHGGDLPVRQDARNRLIPDRAWYHVSLTLTGPAPISARSRPGTVRLAADPVSPAGEFWRFALGSLIRESGF